MNKKITKIDDETILSTPQPYATSTELRKRRVPRVIDNDIINSNDSDESLGLISIKSDNIGPLIEDIQLKENSQDIQAYAREQRELASRMLQRRESKVIGLPFRSTRLSEISSGSHFAMSNSSTISESDLLATNSTSTPRLSISENMETVDIAGTLSRMSLEMRNPSMSLSTALNRMQEEYEKIQKSLSLQSDMFKPAEEAEQLLLADEASWRKEKEIPAPKIDFTENPLDSSDISSISAYFKQRTEDLSDIIPSKPGRTSDIREVMQNSRKTSVISLPSNISAGNVTSSSIGELGYSLSECDLDEVCNESRQDEISSPNKSLSVSKIAKILQQTDETPTKVLNYLLKYCPGGSVPENNEKKPVINEVIDTSRRNILSSKGEETDQDSGNYDPSTLTPNKENFDCINTPQQSSLGKMSGISKSLTSLRSTSSLSNLPGGKLPIETTHCELVWGCVKAGKSETKQFTLRNKSANKVQIQCSISSALFRIMQDRVEDTSNSIKILLRAHETRCITVIFNPLSEGAAVDEIVFSPCNPSLQQTKKQSIKLFGYGGSGVVEFKNRMLKDTSGRHWLSLGNILGQSNVQQSMNFINRGSLPAFAFLEYVSKDLAFSKISVLPNVLIIEPYEEKQVDISLKLSREDMKYLHNNLSNSTHEIGTVKIISGAEATRGRIKRLCKLVTDRNLEMDDLSQKLMQDIQGETIPTDVIKCRESITSLKSLLLGLSQKEIVVVVEKDLDSTLVPALGDDTSMFQSLYQDSTFTDDCAKNNCKLEPSLIILHPPSKCKDILFLSSDSSSALSFEIDVPKGIKAHIRSGTLQPQSTMVIQLEIDGKLEISKSSKIKVNIEGEILTSDVKVK